MTIKEVKEYLLTIDSIDVLDSDPLNDDTRIGVKNAIKSRRRAILKENEIRERFKRMSRYEEALTGVIAGVDEAGRGPLAGEVVAGAVILGDQPLYGLDDSKKLSPTIREELYEKIYETCTVGVGVATVEEIDTLNIYEATKLAMIRAVENLGVRVDHLLVDAVTLDVDIEQQNIIKGDANSNSIAAASIVAKVYRDQLMKTHSEKYEGYSFEKNAGYGTKEHIEALYQKGVTPIHRKTFAPVSDIVKRQ